MQPHLDYAFARTVAPTAAAVTRDQVRAQCNVVADDDDELIDDLIAAATELVESDANLALLTQTYQLTRRCWLAGEWQELPRPPLQSVTAVTYYDANEVSQTYAASNYYVDTFRRPGLLWLAAAADRPPLATRPDAVTITYVAGYSSAANLPQRAKRAILLLVGHWYLNREAVLTGINSKQIELAYSSLIDSLRPAAYP